jgi:hypothetical protein
MMKCPISCAIVKCKTEFEHTQISDTGMSLLLMVPKPEFDPTGNLCVCPNCGYSARYVRTDLLYRQGQEHL